MRKKKLLILGLMLVLITSLTACGDKDYGDISPVEMSVVQDISTDAKIGEGQFNRTKNPFKDYKYDYLNNGRAYMRMPYPKTWEVIRDSDFNITLKAPVNDPHFPGMTMKFRSTLEVAEVMDDTNLASQFDEFLAVDKYSWNGKSFNISLSSEIDRTEVNQDISDGNDNLHIEYVDENAENSENIDDLYFQQQLFFSYRMPCTLNAACSMDKKDDLCKLLEYMMSNTEKLESKIANTKTYDIGNMSIPICPIYEEQTAITNGKFSEAKTFICPKDTGTGFSQSVITAYEVDKKDWIGIETENKLYRQYLETFLQNAFGESAKRNITVVGYIKADDGKLKIGDKEAREYLYNFGFSEVKKKDDSIFVGQAWTMAIYTIKNGDKVNVITLITPRSSLIWSFDSILEIAAKAEFK